jgi:hypothetical protein
MKLPLTFNSLLWLANARNRLEFWLEAMRSARRNYRKIPGGMPADIACGYLASISYWRKEAKIARGWLIDALNGLHSRHGFGFAA